MEFKGDHVLVAGGCGDIGIANAFLDQGKRVRLVDLHIAPGEALSAEHERLGLIELELADEAVTVQALRSGQCLTRAQEP
ncbi:MAG: hypothetical protein OXH76_03940 [Boseongicola sp.]|nr:hypothetical protein [Boseongicola sp.]